MEYGFYKMKKNFLEYWQSGTLLIMGLVMHEPIAQKINKYFFELNIIHLPWYFETFYGNFILSKYLGISIAALVTFFIPPLLVIYDNIEKDILLKEHIKDRYTFSYFVNICIGIVLFGIFQSPLFSIIIVLFTLYKLLRVFRDYLAITVENEAFAINLLGKFLARSEKWEVIKKEYDEAVSKSMEELNVKREYHKNLSHHINLDSKKSIANISKINLETTLRQMVKILKKNIPKRNFSHENSTIKTTSNYEKEWACQNFCAIPTYSDYGKTLSLFFGMSKNTYSKNIVDALGKLETSFQNSFSYREEKKIKREEYFDNLKNRIIEHLKNNREADFNKELNKINAVVKLPDLIRGDDKNLYFIIMVIRSLQDYKDGNGLFEYHHKRKIFNLWINIFEIYGNNCNEDVASYTSKTLLNGLKEFWKNFESDTYRKTSQFFRQRDNVSVTFARAYIKSIVTELGKAIYGSKDKIENFPNICINLLEYLMEDAKKGFNEYASRSSQSSEKEQGWIKIYGECMEATMFLSACTVEAKKEKYLKLLDMIDKRRFLNILSSLYNSNKFNTFYLKGQQSDRHGVMVGALNTRNFWENFIACFVKKYGDHYFDIDNVEISQDVEILLELTVQKIKSENIEAPRLNELLGKLRKEKIEKIGKTSLSEEKINNFIKKLKQGYEETPKISDWSKISCNKNIKKQYFGFYVEEDRDIYIDGENSAGIVDVERQGGEMAVEENYFVLDKINDQFEETTLKKIFENETGHFMKQNDYFFITNFFAHEIFSDERSCKFGEGIEVAYDSGEDWTWDNNFTIVSEHGSLKGLTIKTSSKYKFVILAKRNFLDINFHSIKFPTEYGCVFENNISNRWFVQFEDWMSHQKNEKNNLSKIGLKVGCSMDVKVSNLAECKLFKIKLD